MQAVIYAMIKKDYTTERSREGTAALDDGKRSAAMREVVMNKKTNLLQLEEHFYQLVDVEYRHDVSGRPAVESSLYNGADCNDL